MNLSSLSKAKPLGLLLAFGLALTLSFSLRSKFLELPTPPPTQKPSSTPLSTERFVFAGISGLAPKYIDSGPNRGLGWLEFHTHEIRKGLKADGFQFDMEYMTPARITHEVRSKNPICTYPVELPQSETSFKEKSEWIYSIPLDLKEAEGNQITINRDDLPRFKKHLTPKGNLDLQSLLADPNLKTLLVRDRDYGPITKQLTEINNNGEQTVREPFKKNVTLWVLRDNKQLVEMLQAKRFDYLFSDSLEHSNFNQYHQSHLAFKHFATLRTETGGIKDRFDPRLVMVTIGCSDHPLTRRALASINHWIGTTRGIRWYSRKLDYRKAIDPDPTLKSDFRDSVVQQFRGEFEKGAFDSWYAEQEKWVPDLLHPAKLKPEEDLTLIQRKSEKLPKKPSQWLALRDGADDLILMRDSEAYPEQWEPAKYENGPINVFPSAAVKELLTASQVNRLSSLRTPQNSRDHIEDFPESIAGGLKGITLFASSSLSPADLKWIQKALRASPKLERFSLFYADEAVSSALFPFVPPPVSEFQFANSVMTGAQIGREFQKFPHIRRFRAPATYFESQVLAQILRSHAGSLEDLNLGHSLPLWHGKKPFSSVLEELRFPNLKRLDLNDNVLLDHDLKGIAQSIPDQLESLILRGNEFSAFELHRLLLKRLQRLTELNLSGNVLGIFPALTADQSYPSIQLPRTLKKLNLSGSWLTPEAFQKWTLPQGLSALSLENDKLSDPDLERALSSLGPKVELLALSGTLISKASLSKLASLPVNEIDLLDLDSNRIDDEGIRLLSAAKFRIKALHLRENRITNLGAEEVAIRWLPQLTELWIDTNLISLEGSKSLARALPSQLKALRMNDLLDIDIEALAAGLKKCRALLELQLNNNQLTSSDVTLLKDVIPPGLRVLDLGGSLFRATALRALLPELPITLAKLQLLRTPLEAGGIEELTGTLPPGLLELSLSQAAPEVPQFEAWFKSLPESLRELTLQKIAVQGEASVDFKSQLPNLLSLRLQASQFNPSLLTKLLGSWPTNIRGLYFEGVQVGRQSAEAFAKSFPSTVGAILLNGTHMGDPFFTRLRAPSLQNLSYLQLGEVDLTAQGLDRLLTEAESLFGLTLQNTPHLVDALRRSTNHERLRQLGLFAVYGSPVDLGTLSRLLKNLPPEMWFLTLTSIGLQTEDIPRLLPILPPRVHLLRLGGTLFGQAGIELLQKHKQTTEAREHLFLRWKWE